MDQLEKKSLKNLTQRSTEVIHIEESEYNSILLQAVAVFEKARIKTAKSVSLIVNTAYWEIGKLLYERKLESTYDNRIVERLSADLKHYYPQLGLSPRNLWDMKRFYARFLDSDEKLRQLSQFCHGLITYCYLIKNLACRIGVA